MTYFPILKLIIYSFFAAAIQLKFIAARGLHSLLPDKWQLIDQVKTRLATEVAPFSPIISQDFEILELLERLS